METPDTALGLQVNRLLAVPVAGRRRRGHGEFSYGLIELDGGDGNQGGHPARLQQRRGVALDEGPFLQHAERVQPCRSSR